MVKPKPKPDLYDACILVGFAGMVTGIWWLAPPAALIAGGLMLLAWGLAGSAKAGR
jgi:hypothetical protein